ncbi:uroporphyrinogen-III synthase [Martelella endophytica]|uniref:Uroporphyrinogen-III synthase n=1 Tax=Martelella endophytica TaxID=1486262 RepID=A0A0D5LWA1_MAREN|nr:uroporphyrinogen-III synthase [Martelella endophytica]AJY47693.1 hypothetical protein TM49_21690 [Martelella endophytica]
MRVLVTRPEASAERSAARLAALGHLPFTLPLFEPVHQPDAAIAALAEEAWSAVAVTSAEAVRALGRAAPLRLYAVGEASAKAARDAGFADIVTGPGDGAGLAERIAADGVDRLLYLAGSPRMPDFEQRLAACGVSFLSVDCYRMMPVALSDDEFAARLVDAAPDAVLLYSARTADRFFALGGAAFLPRQAFVVCLSAAVAAQVPAGIPVRIAAAPDEKKLFACLD